jgi:carboxypeptidase Taq
VSATGTPTALADLLERAGELCDLQSIGGLLFWDQNTMMPPAGTPTRADALATLERTIHGRLTDPGLARVLDALAPWAAEGDPEAADVQMVNRLRRDHEKAVRVPVALAAEMSHAAALGQQAWLDARAAGDFARFEPALARQIELRHRYAACFGGAGDFAHPYDVLLDDYEPGLATAELVPLFAGLRDALIPLVAEAAAGSPSGNPFVGDFPVERQRAAVEEMLAALGFEPGAWRLDETVHPFAQSLGPGDVRITTRWDERDASTGLYSVLHEFGHGLYEAQHDPALYRTTLAGPAGLGVHESQSRMWENVIGRSRPFTGWLLGVLRRHFSALDGLEPEALFVGVNSVSPSLIRIDADETTYNLHVVLRFELELAMLEQRLEVRDLPDAWNDGMARLLGLEVPGPVEGVMQDIHWAAGLIGYFPTYTIGNLMTAQLWRALVAAVPDVDERMARGDFAAIREWLGEHVHRLGRRLDPRELLRRATGEPLRMEPLLEYLQTKLLDAGILHGNVRSGA